jgi:uncharacterized protein (DUF885 family)
VIGTGMFANRRRTITRGRVGLALLVAAQGCATAATGAANSTTASIASADVRAIADDYVALRRADSANIRDRVADERALLERLDRAVRTTPLNDSLRVLAGIVRAAIASDTAMAACRHLTDASATSGATCYRAIVRSYSGLDLSADTLMAIGRRELASVELRMRSIAERSFGGRAPDSILASLQAGARLETHAAVDSAAALTLARGLRAASTWFGRLPSSGVALRAYPNPPEGAPAAMYAAPSGAGADSATLYLNYAAIAKLPAAALTPLLLHEGVPGHHLQIGGASGRVALHPVVRLAPLGAFAEGWALYAEQLADEMGLVTSDTLRLLLLNSERQRAARLVADPGIHVAGWSRDTTIAFLMRHGMSRDQATGEFARYTIIPGQATTYTLGLIAIRDERARLARALGSSFDVRRFHDRLLSFGSVPLPVIRDEMASFKAAASSRDEQR